jgi:hypothetical protein
MSRGLTYGLTIAIVALVLTQSLAAGDAEPVSLAGQWTFRLDPQDRGLAEKWQDAALTDKIELPGALQSQGYGEEITAETKWTCGILANPWQNFPEFEKYRQPGSVKVPCWLQPERHYVGAAWYRRKIEIPADWKDKCVTLFLERPHWETRVWLDGKEVGRNESLAAPHRYDLRYVAPGKHTLAIRVDNRLLVDVGMDAHSVSDQTQGNWNGIVGRIELQPHDAIWIDSQAVYPKNDGTVRVKIGIRNELFDSVAGSIHTIIYRGKEQVGEGTAKLEINRGTRSDGSHILFPTVNEDVVVKLERRPEPWSEFEPSLYTAVSHLKTSGPRPHESSASSTFGFRELATQGTQFTLNGQKIFFRGTLECCIFPLTGYPPTDVESWRRIIGVAKAHGLNLFRFHSWCPPEAAFVAADQLGFYFQVECGAWTSVGDGRPIDKWLFDEADRILDAYGNHPSFMLMPYGNEPAGANRAKYLAGFVEHCKEKDNRRLYTSGSAYPQIAENEFHVCFEPRTDGGPQSRVNALPPETRTDYRDFIQARTVPVISHEIGQWCVFPNFEEIPKYTGKLKPKNFEIFRDVLKEHHLGDRAKDFLMASGKLQTLCYKEEIESALRTPGMGGFELLDLHDFPGQGTALVGVLDPFWESKGYVTAAEYSRFCNSTVPLARMGKRVFTGDEAFAAEVEVAHFGPKPLEDVVPAWKIVDDAGRTVLLGKLPLRNIPIGNGISLGAVSADLKSIPAPARYKFVVGLDGTPFENDWDFWVFPPQVETAPPPGVSVVRELDDAAAAKLDAGGKVLLLIPPRKLKGDNRGKVAMTFASIFWNTALFPNTPRTLGILCDPRNPALADFPTEFHSNWQWWYLIHEAGAMVLDDLPPELKPTVYVIDDWFTSHRLALIFEAKVGQGWLMVCSIDLEREVEKNPVARQMLRSLFNYMAGPKFEPQVELKAEQVRRLFAVPSAIERLGGRVVGADSFEPGYEPEKAIDGDPSTFWHTPWTAAKPACPHEIRVEFKTPALLQGVTLLFRQDGNPNGWIKDYAVSISADGKDWGRPIADGSFTHDANLKTVRFAAPGEAKFLRFTAKSGFGGEPFTSLAELDMIPAARDSK